MSFSLYATCAYWQIGEPEYYLLRQQSFNLSLAIWLGLVKL